VLLNASAWFIGDERIVKTAATERLCKNARQIPASQILSAKPETVNQFGGLANDLCIVSLTNASNPVRVGLVQ
jgi:hypothetical protein